MRALKKMETSFHVLLLCCYFYKRVQCTIFFSLGFVSLVVLFDFTTVHFILFYFWFVFCWPCFLYWVSLCRIMHNIGAVCVFNVVRLFFEFQKQFRIFVSLFIRYQAELLKWNIYILWWKFSFYTICYILLARMVPRNNGRIQCSSWQTMHVCCACRRRNTVIIYIQHFIKFTW